MLTPEQEELRKSIDDIVVYIMKSRVKGNLNLNFPGNGLVGGQGKFEHFFPVGAGIELPLREMEALKKMHKNTTNREAARKLLDAAK